MGFQKACSCALALALALGVLASPSFAQHHKTATPVDRNLVLWSAPDNISTRNLYYGPGGKENEPQLPLEFLSEAKDGASPKFDVRDQDGKKWRLKLGDEAQPEIVASRLLWAVGYGANDNYFYSDVAVNDLQHLHRGQGFLESDGKVRQARLQRHSGEKLSTWKWRDNPFRGTREFNGLRVMMALISNWDLRDENNAVYREEPGSEAKLYEVSDVGASFGMSGKSYTDNLSKNNLGAYSHSKFISKTTPTYVSFNFPTHPPFFYVFNPPLFFGHIRMRWIGKNIPRSDAKWIGSLLGQLSTEQIRDAFRAAGYTPSQVDSFADAVQGRIAQLNRL